MKSPPRTLRIEKAGTTLASTRGASGLDLPVMRSAPQRRPFSSNARAAAAAGGRTVSLAPGGRVARQLVYARCAVGTVHGDGCRRGFRRRLDEPRPGRLVHGRVRPALQRRRAPAGRRVPRQHVHDRTISLLPRRRWTPTGISSSRGTAMSRTARARTCTPSVTTPRGSRRAASSGSTRPRSIRSRIPPSRWTPTEISSSPGKAGISATESDADVYAQRLQRRRRHAGNRVSRQHLYDGQSA